MPSTRSLFFYGVLHKLYLACHSKRPADTTKFDLHLMYGYRKIQISIHG